MNILSERISERFAIIDLVGRGGMGEVFKAHDKKLGRDVALKRISASGEEDAFLLASRECRTLAGINHPGVLQIFDFIVDGDYAWLVSEWISGKALDQIKILPSASRQLVICFEIIEGLLCLHEKGIIHRDIKPSNVMLTESGTVKIIDFGAAFNPVSSSGQTVAGSFQYIDPRVLSGNEADFQTDFYSLGITLLEWVNGESVWPNLAPLPLFQHIKKNSKERVKELSMGMHPALRRFVRLTTDVGASIERSALDEVITGIRDSLGKIDAEKRRGLVQTFLREEHCGSEVFLKQQMNERIRLRDISMREKVDWIEFAKKEGLELRLPSGSFFKRSRKMILRSGLAFAIAAILAAVAISFFEIMPDSKVQNKKSPVSITKKNPNKAQGVLQSTQTQENNDSQTTSALSTKNTGPSKDDSPTVGKTTAATEKQLREKVDMTSILTGAAQSSASKNETQKGSANITSAAETINEKAITSKQVSNSTKSTVQKLNVTFDKVGVRFSGNAWADVKIDGKPTGRIPSAKPVNLSPGKYRVEFSSPFIETAEIVLEISGHKPTLFQKLVFKKKTKRYSIFTESHKEIRINGKSIGYGPKLDTRLSYGGHDFYVYEGDELLYKKRIVLTPNSTESINL